MRRKLICFIGTDGSGKSTASKMFEEQCIKKGYRCRYVWGAYDLWLLRPLIKLTKKVLMKNDSPHQNYQAYRKDMDEATKKRNLLNLYRILVFCEYWIELFIKVRLPLMIGYNVICDRYVYDTVIHQASNLGVDLQSFRTMLKKWLFFFPTPDLVIYVATPPEISLQRKDDIPHPDYLRQRIPFYEDIKNDQKIIRIDGTETLEAISKHIQSVINEVAG